MSPVPVIAIFDIGKTNKKLLLFDEQYKMVYEEDTQMPETVDEDGCPCENVQALTEWMLAAFRRVASLRAFDIRALNFAAYGASFVHIDEAGKPLTPLYNYLKPFPQALQDHIYQQYGGVELVSRQTASPVLGSLNSGLQLYRIQQEQPTVFANIRWSLHLPQYLSFLFSQKATTDITSVGCHTLLWNFEKGDYHRWVTEKNLLQKFAPLCQGEQPVHASVQNKQLAVGTGLHDSSAALIPYLASFSEPFVLLSTGTWCISLNPFNQTLLTAEELQQDCLCYLTFQGKPVKASRLFAGNEHELQVKRLASYYNKPVEYYKTVRPDTDLLHQSSEDWQDTKADIISLTGSCFAQRDLSGFTSYEEAYHQLIKDIIRQQAASTQLVINGAAVKRIYVDGGFGRNPLYMHLLAAAYPQMEMFAASLAQATALGAALAVHSSWNSKDLPEDMIELKQYGVAYSV